MALRVRTAHGLPFRRCDLKFGPNWTVVDDETLGERFVTPEATRKSPTVGEILRNEKMLVCEVVKTKQANSKTPPGNNGDEESSKNGDGKGEPPKK